MVSDTAQNVNQMLHNVGMAAWVGGALMRLSRRETLHRPGHVDTVLHVRGYNRRMNPEPVVVEDAAREWEAWPAEQVAERGEAEWKTLISAGLTSTEHLTIGVARLPPGGVLHTHRHEQHEAYLVLDGTGVVTIDGTARSVGPGFAVFIPGNALHSVKATGRSALRVAYVFAADSFQDVEYVFEN